MDDANRGESIVRTADTRFTAYPVARASTLLVSRETADISPFALFKWYEWVMFQDTAVTYPDDAMVLGRDLGPAIDIGPAITRKILKAIGIVVY